MERYLTPQTLISMAIYVELDVPNPSVSSNSRRDLEINGGLHDDE